ncbi:MAG TPA: SMI1/KNR4 family protein [Leptospiraceae bacterium]|nr:SMI1/KNR4 family protein [Leptospiraceae bacterium]
MTDLKKLLNRIRFEDTETIYAMITAYSVKWVAAGFLKEAANLLSEFWKYKIPHSPNVSFMDEGFQIQWETLHIAPPENLPFKFKEISSVENENWSRFFYAFGDEETVEKILKTPYNELEGYFLLYKAVHSAVYNSEEPRSVLSGLREYIHSDDAVGYNYFWAATCGVLLGAKHSLKEETEHFLKLWGEGIEKYPLNCQPECILRDSKTAPYLSERILAPIFRIDAELCRKETVEILKVLSERMTEGRSLVYGDLSWKTLIERISRLAIEQNQMEFSEEIRTKKYLGKEPASEAEILSAEKRLGLRLPEDYRNFLAVSNGMECFSFTGSAMMPADKIQFFAKMSPDTVETWISAIEEIKPSFSEKLKGSILIGGAEEEQQILLVRDSEDRWECWHFANWTPGETVYAGFRFYIESELMRLEEKDI